jgi:non-specific serine/threonine protein kinase
MELYEFLNEYLENVTSRDEERGQKIFDTKKAGIKILEKTSDYISLAIPSEKNNRTYYNVDFYFEDHYCNYNCNCPSFDNYDDCKHCVAAALFLLEEASLAPVININETTDNANPSSSKEIIIPFRSISFGELSMLSRKFYRLNNYSTDYRSQLIKTEGATLWFHYNESVKKEFDQIITFIPPHQLKVECTCGSAKKNDFCIHLMAALSNLRIKHGDFYFNQFIDYTHDKNVLLNPYHLTVEDEEAKDFQFGFNSSGDIVVTKTPSWLINSVNQLTAKARNLNVSKIRTEAPGYSLPPGKFIDFELGFVFNFNTKPFCFSLQPVTITEKNNKLVFAKINPADKDHLSYLKQLPEEQYPIFEELSDVRIRQHLISKGHSNLIYYSNNWQNQLSEKGVEDYREYYYKKIKKLWPFLLEQEHIYKLETGKTFSAANIKPLQISAIHPIPEFKVTVDKKFITIHLKLKITDKLLQIEIPDWISRFFIIDEGTYFLMEEFAHVQLLKEFSAGFLKFPVEHKFKVLQEIIAPLKEKYNVEIDPSLQFESRKMDPVAQVTVAEYLNQYLMLIPQFVYEDKTVDYDDQTDISVQQDDSFYLIERDKVAEKEFYEKLRLLNPVFVKQLQNPFYYLPFKDVMKGNWFLKTIRKLQDDNITVKGVQDLKKFKYNTAHPTFEMKTGSGTDWFDLKIEVKFGNQQVPLRDVQKAINTAQKIVVLDDGTFGVLPEEWLKQYRMIMKMGDEKNGTLRVNKMHFSVINELHSLIDEEEILKELEDKKQRLQNIDSLQAKPVSKKIKAVLRPYQIGGFHWLQALDELGWGGCLADDMGLGKTLQAISFLQFIKEKYKKSTSLVVCPTSLIYNWESEIQKFAPSLKYHIYYGMNREFSKEHLENHDIIITSYGTMRNDIEDLQHHQFHYIILDESQSIKNPEALVTKAVGLLKAKNRIILSGTPVQNNTFDLYAQMNFLNPGFLGNKEFFKTEFAIPIDKNSDSEVAEQLRKMIYPFILRRTKEKVATDLPDKTETILWCEMKKEQRAVYDEYKNYYRHQLINKIEESGMKNAAIYILEGMMRLRQICDSPVLVKDPEVTTTASIKLHELLREVSENSGTHKLLIFSQFTEMLSLVKEAFTKEGITHLYLDGKTPSAKRKELVDQFQTDSNIKAFLISLKAGGVGLNLTAADYVYLIDPWWNPAVEDQAIDRTHRIGQTQKVFAYKMICKDTVEEKILQLQQKKKSLSKELISEEKGFIKKLTKDDVEFLFS